jgi:hypothetical protein
MSRIGKKPITIKDGVKIEIKDGAAIVSGPKGTLSFSFSPEIEIKISENEAIKDIDEMPDEDCLMCPIEDVQFILKKINPFLFASMHKFEYFIRTKAMEGYWMNFDEKFSNQIVFEP